MLTESKQTRPNNIIINFVVHPLVSHPLVPHPIVPHPLVPYPLVPHPLVPHHLVPYPIVPHPLVSHRLVPHPLCALLFISEADFCFLFIFALIPFHCSLHHPSPLPHPPLSFSTPLPPNHNVTFWGFIIVSHCTEIINLFMMGSCIFNSEYT